MNGGNQGIDNSATGNTTIDAEWLGQIFAEESTEMVSVSTIIMATDTINIIDSVICGYEGLVLEAGTIEISPNEITISGSYIDFKFNDELNIHTGTKLEALNSINLEANDKISNTKTKLNIHDGAIIKSQGSVYLSSDSVKINGDIHTESSTSSVMINSHEINMNNGTIYSDNVHINTRGNIKDKDVVGAILMTNGSTIRCSLLEIFSDTLEMNSSFIEEGGLVTIGSDLGNIIDDTLATKISLLGSSSIKCAQIHLNARELLFDPAATATPIVAGMVRLGTNSTLSFGLGSTKIRPWIGAGTVEFAKGSFELYPYAITAADVKWRPGVTLIGKPDGNTEPHITNVLCLLEGSFYESPQLVKELPFPTLLVEELDGTIIQPTAPDPGIIISDADNSQELAFVNGSIQYSDATASKINISATWLADELNKNPNSLLVINAPGKLTVATSYLAFTAGKLSLVAQGDISMNSLDFSGGSFSANSASGAITVNRATETIKFSSGKLSLGAYGDILLNSPIEFLAGSVVATSSAGTITINGDIKHTTASSWAGSGTVVINAERVAVGEGVTVHAGNGISLTGNTAISIGREALIESPRAGINLAGGALTFEESAKIISGGEEVEAKVASMTMQDKSSIQAGSVTIDATDSILLKNGANINAMHVRLLTSELTMDKVAFDGAKSLDIAGDGNYRQAASVKMLNGSSINNVDELYLYAGNLHIDDLPSGKPINVQKMILETDGTLTLGTAWIAATDMVEFLKGTFVLDPYAIQTAIVAWNHGVKMTGQQDGNTRHPHITSVADVQRNGKVVDFWPFPTVILRDFNGYEMYTQSDMKTRMRELQNSLDDFNVTDKVTWENYYDLFVEDANLRFNKYQDELQQHLDEFFNWSPSPSSVTEWQMNELQANLYGLNESLNGIQEAVGSIPSTSTRNYRHL